MSDYLVRFGAFAHVAPFSAGTSEVYRRGEQVICRTRRGLEIAEVLTEYSTEHFDQETAGGSATVPLGDILRRSSEQDQLLAKRLEQNRIEAIQECGRKIDLLKLDVALMDAELLFDGKSLIFYFLGETNQQLEEITQQLAETYESKVQFRKFTDAVNTGCGPACGTEEASGCSTGGGCGSCSLTGACSTRSS